MVERTLQLGYGSNVFTNINDYLQKETLISKIIGSSHGCMDANISRDTC
jgi:hypothetical protein